MLLSPLSGVPADALALDFAWDDDAARLQVSETDAFDTLVTDVPVGGLNRLSLQGLLPVDHRTYYWRVGDDGAWSAPSAFRAASDDDVFEWNKARNLAARGVELAAMRDTGDVAGVSVRPGAMAQPMGGETSKMEAMAFTYFMVASFVILLILVFRSVA